MVKKRKKKSRGDRKADGKDSKGSFFNKPFKRLKLKTGENKPEQKPEDIPPPSPVSKELSDEDATYHNAMSDVTPLGDSNKLARQQIQPKPFPVQQDDASLVMRELDGLVQGEVPFDFADTDEFIEASTAGLDHHIVKKLKRGDYSYQAHLDLHGLNREQARASVADFIRKSHREGKRCLLIVHGRGLGSKDNIPVLKNKLAAWLTRGAIGRRVLAFTSAKPYDGGTGAVYVLLRRG
jgi:DNA-nicking Smr family endonuclease